MAIKKIRVKNFKSFKDLEIELGKFNVLIGANASGKSNFIEIFKFLRDIANHGLDNAISMQGGVEYLRNVNIGSSENLSLEVVLDSRYGIPLKRKERMVMEGYETKYSFTIKFKKIKKRGSGFEVAGERLAEKFEVLKSGKKLGEVEYSIYRNGKEIGDNLEILSGQLEEEKNSILRFLRFPAFDLGKRLLEPKNLLLEYSNLLSLAFRTLPRVIKNISIYNFDPKPSKKATLIAGKAELEEDGSNLAIVIKKILENKEKRRKFLNLIKELLPFVDNVDVERFADRSLLIKLKEKYTEDYLPAPLISDGTINITALIIALYFEEKPLIIVEEPERNIHPYLISKVVGMMKEASQKKQIIVTTHNPEMVKYAGLENILLVSRNEEGFSVISKPREKEEIKAFLENELGIEELYVQNLLA
ncbi:MAG: hypothetical protein PWQ22_8 [Archaeoglobaceae archaeon]|nr:hypothetical protein [Archaeoglobaceae archaeon]MDK2875598.1 hypothetical protein [Archaeoglobaceae archaeon]